MLIRAMEESAIEEMRKSQESRRKAKVDRQKEIKAAEKAKEAALIKEATQNLLSSSQTELIKIEVITTSVKLFAEDSPCSYLV